MVGKIATDIARTLGKALVAGIGVELARVAGSRLYARYGAKKEGTPDSVDDLRKDNATLRQEIERLRVQVEALQQD